MQDSQRSVALQWDEARLRVRLLRFAEDVGHCVRARIDVDWVYSDLLDLLSGMAHVHMDRAAVEATRVAEEAHALDKRLVGLWETGEAAAWAVRTQPDVQGAIASLRSSVNTLRAASS